MSSKRVVLAVVAAALVQLADAAASPKPPAHVVDLTHVLSANFPIVPVPGLTFPFEQKPIASLAKNKVYAEEWHMIAHNGTHMDAPNHYVEGAAGMEAWDARDLIVPAAVIDIREKARTDPDAQLTVDDVLAWEKRYGKIPRHWAVFMYSGWDEKATGDPQKFVGLDAGGKTHFPTLSPEAVELLVKQRDVVGVGVDTLSFDQVESTQKAAAHKVLLGANKWGIECINNLGRIPARGAIIFAGALKVEGASAAPMRLIATW